jgi:hypothetical protein
VSGARNRNNWKEKHDEIFEGLVQDEVRGVPTGTRLFLAATLQFL